MSKNKNINDFDSGKEAIQDIKGYTFKDFINGQYFSSGSLTKHWPYLLFLVLLAFIYINNHYSVEKLLKEQVALTAETQDLKYEAITTSSDLMQMSRQSEVVRRVQEAGLGLEVLKTPPRVLKVD
ncbi:FtsL-like putative cell division protein [Alkaliflexus imshenetskii]|nr:FtsL-like putative cell division protein [Alkaliflexus imshenetskii]